MSQLAAIPSRTPLGHLNSLRSRLGRGAQIGGIKMVERVASSDEFAAMFLYGLDAETRIEVLTTIARALDRARTAPRAQTAISPNERVKIRWSDEVIERFKREAPRIRDNKALAHKLGFPSYCANALKRARSRYLSCMRNEIDARRSPKIALLRPAPRRAA
jgi:hypothetical protein